jgi:tetratricopeptide (TPR) repeat protein
MKRTLTPLAMLALAACAPANPQARLAEARAAFAAEDYVRARSVVLAALASAPGNHDMLLLLARADLALGDGEGAGSALARLADGGMHGVDWNALAAEAALLRGQRAEMDRLLGGDQSAAAWRLRGEAAQAAGDSVAELAAFQRGMAAGADFRLAWDYAHLLLDGDDIDGAERALAVMRQTGRDRLDTWLTTGVIAENRGQFAAAQRAYAEASRRFAARPEPLLALADLADQQGDLKQAAAHTAQAQALVPDAPAVVSMVARIADEQGDWAKVRDLLAPHETTLDRHGSDALVYADALHHLGHTEAARAILQQALSASVQNPKVRIMLAQCAIDLHDGAGALQALRPVADSVLAGPAELDLAIRAATLAHDPAGAGYAARRNAPQLAEIGAKVARASAAMDRRDWAAALAAWSAIPGADTDPQTLKLMALATSHIGQGPLAMALADRALSLDAANPDMMHMAGLVRLNAGVDLAAARALLKKALERDPTNRLFRADYARTGG